MSRDGRDQEEFLPAEGPAPQHLAELMAKMAGRRGWTRRLEGARIHEHWTAIAGEQLARQVQPVRLVGGVLVVRALSPAWATEVRYLAGELTERANAVLGENLVTRVQVVSGRGPDTAKP